MSRRRADRPDAARRGGRTTAQPGEPGLMKVAIRVLLALLPGWAPALELTDAQQRAAGIRVDHPVATVSAPQVEAYGLVIDPVTLVTDIGRMESTQAAWHAAQAEAARVAGLYRDNLHASLKSLQ